MTSPRSVLFLCTGNAARSIMAEAILAHDGGKRFRSCSAGITPKGEVNPLALKTLERAGYPTFMLHSKSWDEFSAPGAQPMDFVITVCGSAAGAIPPLWPGHPSTVHWGMPDPSAVAGTDMEKEAAFAKALAQLKTRIEAFVALPFDTADKSEILNHLRAIRQLG